ncbi:hypothetical protein EPN96_04175 [bacterium]|nr:MAG: hypothetical protein EPN96_04175 [bacterium]
MITRLRQRFGEMELSNRLGYLWLLCFFILVLSVASAILIPILREKAQEGEEAAPAEEEENSLRRQVIEHRLAAAPVVPFEEFSGRFEGMPRV